ncbi:MULTISPECIES: SIP domain-containing protein [unclassified Microbacterium]|uniref:SIP domain-containing protein n=1 Tax=unclassified Microbacterium TaxID=2609290 RepID=UPI00200514F2|nr:MULTISPECIES: SIP domain-containing protein [unclassified Microbacterium]
MLLDAAHPADDLLSGAVAPPHRVRQVEREEPGTLDEAVRSWARAARDAPPEEVYVWLAGETATVTRLRRLLVGAHGIPKDRVAFLGYWREGGPLVG